MLLGFFCLGPVLFPRLYLAPVLQCCGPIVRHEKDWAADYLLLAGYNFLIPHYRRLIVPAEAQADFLYEVGITPGC